MLDPKDWTIIAEQAGGRFLLQATDDAAKGRILDVPARYLFSPMPVQSVLARGYWVEPTRTDLGAIISEMPTGLVEGDDSSPVWREYVQTRARRAQGG